MRKITLLIILIMIFFSKNKVSADYDKVFFDFKINSISGEQIDLKDYENKVTLVVNTASYCGLRDRRNLPNQSYSKLGGPPSSLAPFGRGPPHPAAGTPGGEGRER